ncbi:hypothetical protein BVRB_018650, partial [Beta vulgaris subsp. vulgaris]
CARHFLFLSLLSPVGVLNLKRFKKISDQVF